MKCEFCQSEAKFAYEMAVVKSEIPLCDEHVKKWNDYVEKKMLIGKVKEL